jgi:hypothetical protein
MMRTFLATAIAVGVGLCPSAKAAVTWNFISPTTCTPSPCPAPADNHDIGTKATYTQTFNGSPTTITAYGFNVVGTPGATLVQGTARDLYAKNIPTTDVGLGLATGTANEIDRTGYAEFDLSALLGKDVSFALSSLTGDTYDVYNGASLSPVALTKCCNSTSPYPTSAPFTFNVDSTNDFIAFIAGVSGQSILVTSVTASNPTATPEPRFYGVLLVGLFGLGLAFQRRAKRETA